MLTVGQYPLNGLCITLVHDCQVIIVFVQISPGI